MALDNNWEQGGSTLGLYHGPGVSEEDKMFSGEAAKSGSLGWGEALYSGPSVDYEAELMESRLQQRAHVYTDASSATKTQPHRYQPKEFSWTECREDQMISFQVGDISAIVETLVTGAPCSPNYETLLAPSNGILLLARYAHSLQAHSLFNGLTNLAIHTIHNIVKVSIAGTLITGLGKVPRHHPSELLANQLHTTALLPQEGP